MVHALKQIHSILHPKGLLISIHGLPVPQVVAVQTPEMIAKVGWLLDKNDFIEERCSLTSLAQVVVDGDFILEAVQDFDNNIYADSLPEFQAWLSEWWESAILPDQTIVHIKDQIRTAGQAARIVLAMRARMTKLSVA